MTSNTQDLAKKYQKKTDKQHILDNPDTYIGSVENIDEATYVFDSELNRIVEKNITYVPAVYKLFDEGIVNCRDHTIRMKQVIASSPNEKNYPVTNIDVTIADDGTITL